MRAPRGRADLAAPAVGAAVMGTGIVSVAPSLAGEATLSDVLLVTDRRCIAAPHGGDGRGEICPHSDTLKYPFGIG